MENTWLKFFLITWNQHVAYFTLLKDISIHGNSKSYQRKFCEGSACEEESLVVDCQVRLP